MHVEERQSLPFPHPPDPLQCRPENRRTERGFAVMKEEVVSFQSAGLRLHGVLSVPDGVRAGRTARGVSGAARLRLQQRRARPASRRRKCSSDFGYVTLRFDMRGCGKSEGEFGRVICLEQVEDTGSALELSQQTSARRSRPHRGDRLELRRRRRRLCRRHQPAHRRGRLQRRLGPRRAQIPRPASDARKLGRNSPRCSKRARPTAPAPANR